MGPRARALSVIGGAGVALVVLCAAIVAHDLRDGASLEVEIDRRTRARYETTFPLPALRSPSEDCDGLQRQLDIFARTAPATLSQDVSASLLKRNAAISPTLHAFLADHENGLDALLDATRCTSTKLERLEIGRQYRPGFGVLKHVMWRAEIETLPRPEPAACVTWCNEVLRATLDDSPGEGMASMWHMQILPKVEARLGDCATSLDPNAAKDAAGQLTRLLQAWPPLSVQINGEILATAANLSYFYEAGGDTKWPFHGLRAHVQLRAVLSNLHAILDRPEAWTAVDSGDHSQRLKALDDEIASRPLHDVPFADAGLVSPGWDSAVGSSNSLRASLESIVTSYLEAQALVRMGRAALLAPNGDLAAHADDPLAQDPFASHLFHFDAAKRSYYSVGPNGVDDAAGGDDVVLGGGQ